MPLHRPLTRPIGILSRALLRTRAQGAGECAEEVEVQTGLCVCWLGYA